MQQQDYIERLISQIAAAVGRILGLAHAGQPEDARRELEATWSRVVGFRRADVDRLDEMVLRTMLGDKRVAASALLDAEAEMARTAGDPTSAARLAALAARLRE